MLLMRAVTLLLGLFCLAVCLAACAGEAAGSREGTDAFVHRQLERRGL